MSGRSWSGAGPEPELGRSGDHPVAGRRRLRRLHTGDDHLSPELPRAAHRLHRCRTAAGPAHRPAELLDGVHRRGSRADRLPGPVRRTDRGGMAGDLAGLSAVEAAHSETARRDRWRDPWAGLRGAVPHAPTGDPRQLLPQWRRGPGLADGLLRRPEWLGDRRLPPRCRHPDPRLRPEPVPAQRDRRRPLMTGATAGPATALGAAWFDRPAASLTIELLGSRL